MKASEQAMKRVGGMSGRLTPLNMAGIVGRWTS